MRCQMGEPVNPVTTSTPSWAAARAVSFIRCAARLRTPSGSPSPHTSGGRAARWRSAIRAAPAPPLRRQDRSVALVDRVAHRLTDEMVADRPAAESVPLEDRAPARAVAGIPQRLGDVEVIAPARQLQPVEPPTAAL